MWGRSRGEHHECPRQNRDFSKQHVLRVLRGAGGASTAASAWSNARGCQFGVRHCDGHLC